MFAVKITFKKKRKFINSTTDNRTGNSPEKSLILFLASFPVSPDCDFSEDMCGWTGDPDWKIHGAG